MRVTDKGMEIMYLGELHFDKKASRFVMPKPQMVIGTDRLELYEFFARQKEVYNIKIRTIAKLCIGLTAAHFVIV
jgi:hypothetical protein